MSTNTILPFSGDPSANVLTDAAYASASQRLIGNQPGIASAQLNNKALRQATLMSTGFAQFIANRQGTNISDSLTPTQIETAIQAALAAYLASLTTTSSIPSTISTASTSWWRKSADGFIEQGVAGIVIAAGGATRTITFPIPFVTSVLDIQVSVYNAATDQVGWQSATLTNVILATGTSDIGTRTVNMLVKGY